MPDPRDTMPEDVRRIYDRELLASDCTACWNAIRHGYDLSVIDRMAIVMSRHAHIALALRTQEERIQKLRAAMRRAIDKIHEQANQSAPSDDNQISPLDYISGGLLLALAEEEASR